MIKKRIEGLTVINFKTYSKTTEIKIIIYGTEESPEIDQWNRKEHQESSRHTHTHTNWFSTKAPSHSNGNIRVFEQILLENLGIWGRNYIDPYFILSMKINLIWIIDLNIKTENVKLLGENLGKYYNLWRGKGLLNKT